MLVDVLQHLAVAGDVDEHRRCRGVESLDRVVGDDVVVVAGLRTEVRVPRRCQRDDAGCPGLIDSRNATPSAVLLDALAITICSPPK